MGIVKTKYMAGAGSTAAVLLYAYLDNPQPFSLEEDYSTELDSGHLPLGYKHNPYYTILNDYSINNQIKAIHNFVSRILEESQDLDPRFSEIVDKHFWELV